MKRIKHTQLYPTGFSHILLIIFLVVILLICLGFVFVKSYKDQSLDTPMRTESEASITSPDQFDNDGKYESAGFTFEYNSSNWKLNKYEYYDSYDYRAGEESKPVIVPELVSLDYKYDDDKRIVSAGAKISFEITAAYQSAEELKNELVNNNEGPKNLTIDGMPAFQQTVKSIYPAGGLTKYTYVFVKGKTYKVNFAGREDTQNIYMSNYDKVIASLNFI